MATATSVPPQERLSISSDGETIEADLYGRLPAVRVAILVHGQNWDASGWRGVAPLFVARGVPALAVNLRGYAGSTGKTNRYRPDKPWTPVADLRAAKAALRGRGVKEIAPVAAVPDELSKKISGRKLFVCADRDSLRATPNVLSCFTAAPAPKKLVLFGGREHSRAMFNAAYGDEALGEIVEFVCRRG